MGIVFQILAILLLLGVGALCRWGRLITAEGTRDLSKILMSVVYPALILRSILGASLDELLANWELPLLAMALALIGYALGWGVLLARRGDPPATRHAFLYHCLVNNYLFLPLPIVMVFFGDQGVALLIFSSLGMEVIIWTLGIAQFARGASWRAHLRMMRAPAPMTLLFSIALVAVRDSGWLPIDFNHPAPFLRHMLTTGTFLLTAIGQATVILGFLVGGSRLAQLHPRQLNHALGWIVAGIRLVAVPALMWCLLRLLPLDATARGVFLVVATMPAAINSVVMSERYGGDTDFMAGSMLLTHLLALATIPFFLSLFL